MNNTINQTAFAPSLTASELTHQFISTKKQVRKYNQDSEYLDALAHGLNLLSINRQPFTQSSFLVLTRAFYEESEATHTLLRLFFDWIAFMKLNRKIREEFVIDYPTYYFL